MAEAVVSCVLGKITEAAYQEALSLYQVGDKVEWAKRELKWVSAFLKDADAKRNKDARVEQWVEDVKEVAYMIEDALDSYIVKMGGGRPKGVLTNLKPKALIARHKIGSEIDKIKERMNEIKANRENFGITILENSSKGPARVPLRPLVIPEIDKTEVVGFKDDADNICKQLLDESVSRRSAISIVGPGGRGKTTLGTKVYKSAEVQCHFHRRIWVTISQEFKIIDILKKMLKLLGTKIEEVGDEEYFITELHKTLSKKRYLIVLDDVWSNDLWTQLETALPEDHIGSRVLITSRFINIGKESDAVNTPYELRILSEDESQQLLLKKVFPNQFANECPNNLLPLIKQFAQKCGGWPLALVVLGGILSNKDPEYNTWNEIMLKMDWHTEGSKCLDIISTSYDDLPTHLKPCFMYIASFPEDYKIKGTTLVQLWIVEGFIQHDQSTKTMEDIAEGYLEELVERCMIQVSERSWSGRVKYCYVHDILHELAIRKAKENNFLLVCSKFNANPTHEMSANIRRIAFHECVNTELQLGSVSSNLRSLFWFVEHKPNYSELRMVRVLHLECGYWKLLQDSEYLKHLTTLRYFRSYRGFDQGHGLPSSFWNNKMLKYVKIEGECFVMGPLPSVNLENLLILKGVIARDEWNIKFPHFPNIRKLGVYIEPTINWEAITHSMSKLKHLYSLSIFTCDGVVLSPFCFKNFEQLHSLFLDSRWPRGGVVDSSSFPPNLVKLSLKRTYIDEDTMPKLMKLPNLRILHLQRQSYEGSWLICSAGGFRCLQQLKLGGLPLWKLEVEEGAIPMLNLLEIKNCKNLKVPNLQYLTNLRELKLSDMHHEEVSQYHKLAAELGIKVSTFAMY